MSPIIYDILIFSVCVFLCLRRLEVATLQNLNQNKFKTALYQQPYYIFEYSTLYFTLPISARYYNNKSF